MTVSGGDGICEGVDGQIAGLLVGVGVPMDSECVAEVGDEGGVEVRFEGELGWESGTGGRLRFGMLKVRGAAAVAALK